MYMMNNRDESTHACGEPVIEVMACDKCPFKKTYQLRNLKATTVSDEAT